MKTHLQRASLAAVAAAALLAVAPAARAATVIGYWKFDEVNATPGNHNTPADNFQVVDSSGNLNQMHSYQGDGDGYNYASSTDLPSPAVFAGSNRHSWAPNFNDPQAGGVFFHEVNFAGNNFAFSGQSFTLEGYFKTSNSMNRQDVIFNAQNQFSYLVNVNEGGPGVLRFATGGSPNPQVNLGGGAGHNYANGEWHYFIARYEERGAGQQDVLTLTTYGENGALIESGTALAPAGFNIFATTNNLALGGAFFQHPFRGLIDEVRISRGLVQPKWQLNNVTVAVDTFDNTRDYKAAGVAGTIWDGLLNPAGASVIATTNGPALPGDGNLEIAIPSASQVGFDAVFNNAPFLFKTMRPAEDFDAQLVIESTTFGNYSAAGLMVRLADPLSDGVVGVNNREDFLSLVYHNFGTVRNTVRNLDDGAQSDVDYNTGAVQRFLRITREGDLFSLYTRPDDFQEWTLLTTRVRPDLAGTVQVGLWHGYFGGGTAGSAQFENFLLTSTVPEPGSLALLALGAVGLALGSLRRRQRA